MSAIPVLEKKSSHASLPEPTDSKEDGTTVSVVEDLQEADEALQLVGKERTTQFSEEYNAKLRWKLDMVIPPLCGAVYFTQYLDKTALSYASIMGFPMKGQDYNLVALSFYVGFLIWVFPTMYIAQRARLGKYLGANIIAWGIVLCLHVIPNTFGPLFALRLILGALESCVAPILILINSMFYRKNEQALRIACFYALNPISSIFGGFVAYGISFNKNPKWPLYKIFYLVLGLLAVIVGLVVMFWMPDSPLHARMLNKEERIAAVERVRDDQGGTENKRLKKDQLVETFLDIRTWLIVLTTLLTAIPNGGLANFGNIIVVSFGYTARETLILGTPGSVIGLASVLLCGYFSDKLGERMTPIAICILPTLAGAGMLIGLNGTHQKGALLFATYIIGTFGSSLSLTYAWNASNTSGHTKKVTLNAMTLAAFCVGNIVGTETFLPKDAPGYLPGKISILVLLSSQLVVCFLLRWVNLHLNKKKRAVVERMKERNNWTDADIEKEREKHAFMDLTDRQNPFFVYTHIIQ